MVNQVEQTFSNKETLANNVTSQKVTDSDFYSYTKVVDECIKVGLSKEIAECVAKELDKRVKPKSSFSDVRPMIFALLQRIDPTFARKFKNGNEIYVRTTSDTFEKFNKDKITTSLIKETGLDLELASKIATETESFLHTTGLDFVSSPLIREVVNVKLLENRQEDARKRYTRLGLPIYDVEQMINQGISTNIKRENANLQHSPETINWIISGEALEQYSLVKLIPGELADPHMSGDYHIHILSNIATRPNCMQHSPQLFFKKGLCVDGTGRHTSVAGPAKHITVALQHSAKVMMAAQTMFAGGQSIDCFNVWMAPFLKGLSDKELEQAIQEYIYEMNQSYISRGGQTVFSSVNFEFGVPNWLKEVPAIGPGGKIVGTYGDYEEEALKFLREYVKIKVKGDYVKKQHMFPNDVFKVRKNVLSSDNYNDELKLVHEYIAKYGTPYIANGLPDWQTENFNYMGCRTRLDANFAGVWGTQRTGNDVYITLNLPRIAYLAKGDDNRFFELLHENLEKMAKVLIIKNDISEKLLHHQKLLPFLTQDFDGEEYYQFKNTTKTFGYVGLTEAAKHHCGAHLHEGKDAQAFGERVIQYMRNFSNEMVKKTGLRFSVIASPAETCGARLARLDISKFGAENVPFSGTKEAPYYTNSHMVKMNADVPLWDKLKIEEKYHPLTNGGHIAHIWLGEQSPSADVLLDMTRKICNKTDIGFFSYTRDYSVCNPCHSFTYGLRDSCPKCSSDDMSQYSRITGYYQEVKGWNSSKKAELKERYRYNADRLKGCE